MSIFDVEPFLIAEIGVNYYDIAKKENISNMEAAKLMVKEAKDAGCGAVKFQSYKADTIASKNSPAYWDMNDLLLLSMNCLRSLIHLEKMSMKRLLNIVKVLV